MKNQLIAFSSLFGIFILCGYTISNEKQKQHFTLKTMIWPFIIIHVIFGFILRNYNINIFSSARNVLGFILCSIGQIYVSKSLYDVIYPKDNGVKPSGIVSILYWIAIIGLLSNLLMRIIIIIFEKGRPLKNDTNIQIIYSNFTKKTQTGLVCPFKFINKFVCSYAITIIIGLLIFYKFWKISFIKK